MNRKSEHKNQRLAERNKKLKATISRVVLENYRLRKMLETYAEQLIELGEEYRALRDLLNPHEWQQREYEALFTKTEKENGRSRTA